MVKFVKSKPVAGGGPSSALGITRFFDAESKSPKISPYFVAGIIIVFILIIVVLKTFL